MAIKDKLTDELKKKIVRLVDDCCIASDRYIGLRIDAWEQAEKMVMSYQPKAKAERKARDGAEKEGFSQLKIPYAWGLLMAQHTYLASVFLGRSTVFQYLGKNGKGQTQVPDVETIINHQVTNGGIKASMYVALYDLLMYGVMGQFYTWREDVTYVTSWGERPVVNEGIPVIENGVPVMEEVEEVLTFPGYKGGGLINTKPKDLIVDPSVGFVNYQDGQFIGRRYEEKLITIQQKEKDGLYFDTDKLTASATKDDSAGGNNPALYETEDPGTVTSLDKKAMKGNVAIREVYLWVIPSELGLGKNTRPEIWVFTVADRNTLIGCQPSGWMHGKFPAFIAVTEYDGYTLSSRGTPEIAKPLNDTMDWLINTHMYNVEKSVNNEFIYDPSMINQRDFLDPSPGKRIKIKPEAYGRDVRTFIHQFQQYDFTRQNIGDVGFIESLFQRVFGVNEQMLGALAGGDRKTATEVRTAAGFALNRLKVLAEWLGQIWFEPLGRQLLSASRQMYTQEDTFSIVGGASEQIRDFTVEEITGEFDLAAVDGSIPIDRMAQVSMLREILMGIQQLPAIAGRYDVAKFFEHMIQLMGVKNMDQFKIVDPAQIQKEAELGNLVTGGNNGRVPGSDNRTTGIADSGVQAVNGA